MKIEPTRWHDWDALRCTAGDFEMVVGISSGPRILSLRQRGGENLLYRDHTDFRVGEWRMHGGHRFVLAPECEASYAPDNDPCNWATYDEVLHVSAARDVHGRQRNLAIRPANDGPGFDIDHVLANNGESSWIGALWAITCVPASGQIVAPRTHPRMHFWQGNCAENWQISDEQILVQPGGARGKAGWYCPAGWVASLQHTGTLVIESVESPPIERCLDGGCNIEVFVCADYAELETLGSEVVVAPGTRTSHLQRWRVLEAFSSIPDCGLIAAQAGCFAPLEHAI